MQLLDVCELIVDCEHKTAPTQEEGYPSIRTPNIGQGYFILENVNRVSEETYSLWTKRVVPQPGDLIMAREAPVGNVAMIPDELRPCLGQRTLLIRPDRAKVEPSFLNYFLNGPHVQGLIHAKTNGVTVAHLNMKDVRTMDLPMLPPLPVQRRIAGILSAYDELIENSQRRIRLLEAMARALYRERFVHFRFPDHEKFPRVASPLGEIPQGWEAIPFEKLLASMTGGDWGSDQPTEDESAEVCIIRGTDFNEVACGGELRVPIRYIKTSSLKSRGLRPGDVIVENSINAKSRCIGTTLLVDSKVLTRIGREAVAASFCKVFRLHDPRLAPLVHLHFRRLRENARMEYYQNVAANGIGNFQAQKFVKEEHLILPKDESFRSKLIEKIDEIFESISVLSSKLSNLRQTRTLLLPRLLSGQIEIATERGN